MKKNARYTYCTTPVLFYTATIFFSASSALLLHTPLGSLLQSISFPSSPVDPSSCPSSSKSTLHTGVRVSSFDTSCATCATWPSLSLASCARMPPALDRAPAKPAPMPEGEFRTPEPPPAPFSRAVARCTGGAMTCSGTRA